MRVLVCGGRDYANKARVFYILDRVHAKNTISLLIHGQARGADALARVWADDRGIAVVEFPANWTGDGRKAGTIRNQRMLDMSRPDGVVAFPGGSGTADMVRIAKGASVPVWEIDP